VTDEVVDDEVAPLVCPSAKLLLFSPAFTLLARPPAPLPLPSALIADVV